VCSILHNLLRCNIFPVREYFPIFAHFFINSSRSGNFLHDFLLKFHAPYDLCLHGFFLCNHRVTAFLKIGGGYFGGPKKDKGGVLYIGRDMSWYKMNRGEGGLGISQVPALVAQILE